MENQDLIDYLKECGVCQVCQLRYLKARGNEYVDMKESFEKLNVKYDDSSDDVAIKKQRPNTCPTCLGLFSMELQAEMIQAILSQKIEDYESSSIMVAISLPMLLQIRQLSMWYALLEKFGKDIDTQRAPDVPLKEAVKLILNPIICGKLMKSYDPENGLMININLRHPDEEEEVAMLHKCNIPGRNGGGKKQAISRGILEKHCTPKTVNVEEFKKFVPIPPTVPNGGLQLESITMRGPVTYVAGRYRKISRKLSHTPWVLNGVRVMENSIEEIIINDVAPYFSCSQKDKVIFMSSGREDVDVRCLGKGRPFVLEIPNSHRVSLPRDKAHEMEQAIDRSLLVSVRNLQVVQREELTHIKSGEEEKRKIYRALCKLETPASVEILEKLNLPEGFEIQQKTPLRVLHRRPLHTRPRMIYSLRASVCRDNPRAVVLDIISQAGTYIKELVHGEFGRTRPSIASLIGQPLDIIALDVAGIDLDWPEEVDNGSPILNE